MCWKQVSWFWKQFRRVRRILNKKCVFLLIENTQVKTSPSEDRINISQNITSTHYFVKISISYICSYRENSDHEIGRDEQEKKLDIWTNITIKIILDDNNLLS